MSKSSPSLNEIMQELERVVVWFDQEDLDVEQAIKQFEKGAELAEKAREQLETLENKITVLKQRFDHD